ncbi:hypothetical protein TVAG_475880 [Trichomonas vaginalis G3]|uniref:CCR4-NOT transcription complex subunit 11 n=1 Tax=Trichomonas vaginalis (strain ATCC PRA-98 / G3) TaxID=412133 RepID=A2DA12_TRIV3|nr:gene silencing by RNA [Trichomonas vaginalis G3]EAY22660.1 hypothetical protein TVAG_475880 [Trichomonas vaginalis G3]KAI5525474.1 gene silencing by RNA [Trichomonas vaginalis G3]|eukprot:XP_001583646.1 hypothetical protein [Trichomonas vaginalis G3]
MLSDEDAKFLIALISEKDETLTSLYKRFIDKFDFKKQIQSINILTYFLADCILEHTQQFVSFWIIYQYYYNPDINQHPYKALFSLLIELHQTKQGSSSQQMYSTLTQLISGADISILGEYTINRVFGNSFPFYPANNVDILHSKTLNVRCSPLISEPNQGETEILSLNEVLEQLITCPAYVSEFEPPTIHTPPDVFPITDNEVNQLFISSLNVPPLLFDESHSAESIKAGRELLVDSISRALTQREIQTLNSLVFSDNSIISEEDTNEQNFDKIAENNPEIAILIIKALPNERQRLSEYLSNAPKGPDIVTTVKMFVLENFAPPNFIRSYITSTMTAIRSVKDNGSAVRICRPFCEVMIDMINAGVKIDGSLIINLTSICDDMRKFNIKEASALQSLLSADYL